MLGASLIKGIRSLQEEAYETMRRKSATLDSGMSGHQTPPNGRDRLIDAAIKLFGRDGFDATSVRAVADEAGVSWGLVRFCFGSKEGLREAAEERVVTAYLNMVTLKVDSTSNDDLFAIIESITIDLPEIARFLRRAIIEERPIARDFIERLIQAGGNLELRLGSEFPDEAWLVDPLRSVTTRLGYLLLAPQFLSILGRDVFSVEEVKLRNQQTLRMFELLRKGLQAEK